MTLLVVALQLCSSSVTMQQLAVASRVVALRLCSSCVTMHQLAAASRNWQRLSATSRLNRIYK